MYFLQADGAYVHGKVQPSNATLTFSQLKNKKWEIFPRLRRSREIVARAGIKLLLHRFIRLGFMEK